MKLRCFYYHPLIQRHLYEQYNTLQSRELLRKPSPAPSPFPPHPFTQAIGGTTAALTSVEVCEASAHSSEPSGVRVLLGILRGLRAIASHQPSIFSFLLSLFNFWNSENNLHSLKQVTCFRCLFFGKCTSLKWNKQFNVIPVEALYFSQVL